MLYAIAKSGFLVMTANYRLSPMVRHPSHLMDCKRSLAWLKAHAAEFGGDPNFVVVGGESAGAHLACLLALTPNVPHLQPGLEDVDTSVQGCVDLYGLHDLSDTNLVFRSRDNPLFGGLASFLARFVMGLSIKDAPGMYSMASPLYRLQHFVDHPNKIPAFFASHGSRDDLIPVHDSIHFYQALTKKREEAKKLYEEEVAEYERRLKEYEREVKAIQASSTSSSSSTRAQLPPPPRRPLPPLPPHDVFIVVPGASHAYNQVMSPRSFALNDCVTVWLHSLLSHWREREALVRQWTKQGSTMVAHSSAVSAMKSASPFSNAAISAPTTNSSDSHSHPEPSSASPLALEAKQGREVIASQSGGDHRAESSTLHSTMGVSESVSTSSKLSRQETLFTMSKL